MKKVISLIISICIAITGLPIVVYADEAALEEFTQQAVEMINSDKTYSASYEEEVSKRVIVKSTKKIDTFDAVDIASGFEDYYILEFPNSESAQKAVEYYNTLSYVTYASVDSVVTSSLSSYSSEPNGHMLLNTGTAGFDELEKYLEDNNITYSEKLEIAVIDTGVEDTHEFLAGRVEPTEYNFSNSGTENSAFDDEGHGTHVAGVIVDNTPDNVVIKPYKVLNNEGKGSNLSVILAIEQAIADDVDIINMSLESDGYDEAMHDAVKKAYDNNIPVVVAAGDGGFNLNNKAISPASFEECITVMASNEECTEYTDFTNWGKVCDVAAPGVDIYSSFLNNTYRGFSGTSMATPFVSAAVAYILLEYQDITSAEVEQMIKEYAIPLGYTGQNVPINLSSTIGGLYVKYILSDIDLNLGIPVFSRSSCEFETKFELELSAEDGVDIYYRLNNSTSSWTKYENPITIKYDTTITAYCYKKGFKKGEEVTQTYKKIFTGDESDFEIDENGTLIEYYNDKEEVIIPEVFKGITVKEIGRGAFKNKSLKTVSVPSSITKIGESAFANCQSLEYIDIGSVQEIGDLAFFECQSLEYINTDSVQDIGRKAFNNCKSLKNIYADNLRRIGVRAFEGCSSLEAVYGNNIQDIESCAFQYCHSLVYIDTSNENVISDYVFSECKSLSKVDLSNVELIGDGAFRYCNIPIFVSDKVKTLGESVFEGSNVELIDFPAVKQIYRCVFSECSNLKKVNLPAVTEIREEAFYKCKNLKEINIDKVTRICEYAFYECESIEKLYLPNLKELGGPEEWNHFFGCTSLKEFYAPELRYLACGIFNGCTELKSLVLPGLVNIYKDTFGFDSVEYLYAPNLKNAASLPSSDNAVVVTSSAFAICNFKTPNSTLTIQGEKGTFAEEYANEYNLEFVDVDAMGGSIRITDAGLRFGYSFYDTQDKSVEEFGFIYANGDVNSEHLIADNADNQTVFKYIANNRLTHDDGLTTFNLVFTDVPKSAYNMNVSVRAYVKIDGIYLYSDVLTRSFRGIGEAVLADETVDQNTKDAINKFLEV